MLRGDVLRSRKKSAEATEKKNQRGERTHQDLRRVKKEGKRPGEGRGEEGASLKRKGDPR